MCYLAIFALKFEFIPSNGEQLESAMDELGKQQNGAKGFLGILVLFLLFYGSG